MPGRYLILLLCLLAAPLEAQPITLKLWHAYTGDERAALEASLDAIEVHHGGQLTIEPLYVPFDVLPEKLRTMVPRGRGPDLFIFAHDRVGNWVDAGLLEPAELPRPEQVDAKLRSALSTRGQLWGVPLTYKGLFLYVNTELTAPPAEVERLFDLRRRLPQDTFPLAYDTGSFFFHAPFFFGTGGQLFDGDRIAVLDEAGRESFELVVRLVQHRVVPEEMSTARVTQLFNEGRAAVVLSGPWFRGEIDPERMPPEKWTVAPLFQVKGRPAGSLISVEGVFLPVGSPHPRWARSVALALLDPAAIGIRRDQAGQPSPLTEAEPAAGGLGGVQRAALEGGRVTPNRPEMAFIWEVTASLLRELLHQGMPPDDAFTAARRRLEVMQKPPPPGADPDPWIGVLSALLLLLAGWMVWRLKDRRLRQRLKEGRVGYLFSAPALVALTLLTLVPFVLGAGLALFHYGPDGVRFVGLANFVDILGSQDYPLSDPLNFYFTLAVTVLWTVLNVALHVGLGLGLALLLRPAWLRLRGVYRVLLILPWAVPSYITALTWKAMFNKQFGAINQLLGGLGLEPVSWFGSFATAFAANVATNTWLGFPFMMVVSLGALQAVPPELEEVARLEGAGPWQRFRWVILPHLKPVLLPAVILGSVWTFNMFNVIYLVSGGEPSGATEILISEAYKWAFRRQHRYGYAAAYAVLIFLVLLGYTLLTERVGRERKA